MKRFVTLIAMAGLALAACGTDDDGAAGTGAPADVTSAATEVSADTTPSTEAVSDTADTTTHTTADTANTTANTTADSADDTDDAAYPVTIEHRYGSTTVDATPERIVSLDPQWTDVLLALDTPPAGFIAPTYLETGLFPWQEGLLDDSEPIPATDSLPYEAIAALDPDLIVITYFAVDQATYDQLNEIAPTIGPLTEAEVDQWQDMATAAGAFLDRPDDTQALIDDSARRSADVVDELPGLDGRTYALANYVAGDGIYVVADPDDGASTFFASIGLQIDPELLAAADGATGRLKISTEQIGMLDSDLLILLTNGADPNEIPGYDALPAVRSGAVAILDVPTVSGLNTPSPLSIPYALDAIRPALEAAAAGG